MRILIVSATTVEVGELLTAFDFISDKSCITNYKFKEHFIDVLIPGPGMVATAFFLGRTLSETKYDIAFNFGIAGSFLPEIKIGDLVHVNSETFSDLGAEDGEDFLSLTDINLQKEVVFPFVKGQILNPSSLNNSVLNSLLCVPGITVNTVHGNTLSIKKIKEKFNPSVETMEGAAFLFACLTENVPCFQIRSISNAVERRNKDSWNIPLAVKNLNDKALEILNCLC